MARERIDRHTMRLLQEIGLPYELSDEEIDKLAARILETYSAELGAQQQEFQIGSVPNSANRGGTESPDRVEDGAPIMLDNV